MLPGEIQRIQREIEGLISGVMWVLSITQLLILPANAVVKAMFNVDNLVVLPLNGALILILISVVLTPLQVLFLQVGQLSPIQFRH